MPSISPPPLLRLLRKSTEVAHNNLDTAVNLEKITSSPEACAHYIARFSAAFAAVSGKIDWHIAEELSLPELAERRDRYDQLPSSPFPYANSSSICETVGTLYVLEGSIHGGAVILRKVRQNYPDATIAGSGFLVGFGDRNTESWRSFVSWLGGLKLSAGEMNECCRIACDTFDTFHRYLDEKDS